MMMPEVTLIAQHASTGSGTSHLLGTGEASTHFARIPFPIRHIHVYGTFDATIKIEASMDGANWVDWICDITAPGWFIIESGPLYIRSNCTTYVSGTANVKVQKFIGGRS